MSENKIDKFILLFSKKDEWCKKVFEYLKEKFKHVVWWTGEWGEEHGWDHKHWVESPKYDYIISYLFPAVLPKHILELAKEHAINFHPAPPKYPGIGGYNYAIWNGDETYGVMVHEMDEKVDSGFIYEVKYFPVSWNIEFKPTVKELKEKSMIIMFDFFKSAMEKFIHRSGIYSGAYPSQYEWHTPPYTRKDFQKACEIYLAHGRTVREDVLKLHIERKVRAFYFPGARDAPFFLINGKKYKVTPVD